MAKPGLGRRAQGTIMADRDVRGGSKDYEGQNRMGQEAT